MTETTTKHATRYRVTINGEIRYRDDCPDDANLARIEEFIMNRGGHARVDRCETTINPAMIGTGRGVEIHDTCIFETEG